MGNHIWATSGGVAKPALARRPRARDCRGMVEMRDSMDLSGKLLIAMPGMGDTRFEKSVIFLCAHSPEGAMGLIVNKPLSDLSFATLLRKLKIPSGGHGSDILVHLGGPVEHARGFVLHSGEYRAASTTMQINESYGLTATLDVLQDISAGHGPVASLLALGYSGWGPGQLEREIGQNGWLTCDAPVELVFSGINPTKWERALKTLGVDPLVLSATAGRA